ncbi:MAG TPA: tetratricopeptide repeat protein [Terriglobales bacterium]|nr:tetratricopeptide repeat protein [Terriglobales bacterium]
MPKRTDATPVQKLNRDGVKALQKNEIAKAQKLFYKAYLIDPDDPFTLNNLGYLSELQGKVERAQQYYGLAAKENSEAEVAEASVDNVKGRKLSEVTSGYGTLELSINRGNIEGMSLLQQGRTSEAESILRRTLQRDPKNAFTINNLGTVMEAEGDLNAALSYYSQAEALHSSESVVVAVDPHWRGKSISEVAAANAEAIRTRLASEESVEARANRLSLLGVYALNHNDPEKAQNDFEQAYKLDPQNAFALNNRGYVAETEGDQELANDYYTAAKEAPGAGQPVAVTNHVEMKGMPLSNVADSNDQITEAELEARQAERRRRGGPIELRRRDNTSVSASPEQPAETPVAPHALVPRPPVDNAPVDNGPIPPYVPRPPQN